MIVGVALGKEVDAGMGFAANHRLGEEFAVLGVLYANHKGAGVVVVLLPFGGGVGAPAYAHDGAAAFFR